MKISGLGLNVTQEKWNFSLVLMETIVDTLLKVSESKIKLAQLKAFTNWKQSRFDIRTIYWATLRKSLGKLSVIYGFLRKKTIVKAFFQLNQVKTLNKLKATLDEDLEEIKHKYKTKLMYMSQEINDLNEKQLVLEKSSAEYIQKERKYKASIKALEENSEAKEPSSEEFKLLQSENLRLKSRLQNKEAKLIAYFEGLSVMIDGAPISLSK